MLSEKLLERYAECHLGLNTARKKSTGGEKL